MFVFRNLTPIEVSEGSGQIVIEVDLEASGIVEATTVKIATVDGTARSTAFNSDDAGLDFSAINDLTTVIDPDNPNTSRFTIDITNDAIAEAEENFQFQITAVEDESLNGIATITIIDDEETINSDLVVENLLPEIAIDSIEQLEGDSSTTNFEFAVSLSEPSQELVTVDYSTIDGTAESEDRLQDLEIVDFADYIPVSGTLEFIPGSTEQTISVEVLTDSESLVDEAPQEAFAVNLSNATNGDIRQPTGTGTILDDDFNNNDNFAQLLFLQLEDRTFVEGNESENTTQELTVNLVNADGEPAVSAQNITFEYSTVDVTAIANIDYQFIDLGSATIPQGESNVSIPITIIGDAIIESEETFSVVLSPVDSDLVELGNAEPELSAEISITDDDSITDDEDNLDVINEELFGNSVFRFFDSAAGVHFYTVSEIERDFIEDNLDNYVFEGTSFASVNPESANNKVDVYRFFNSETGGHFYTASEVERNFVIDNLDNFVFEDVAFSAFETNVDNTVPVYRFFEVNTSVHFYTTSEIERDFVTENLDNYNFEGIAFYGFPVESDIF